MHQAEAFREQTQGNDKGQYSTEDDRDPPITLAAAVKHGPRTRCNNDEAGCPNEGCVREHYQRVAAPICAQVLKI